MAQNRRIPSSIKKTVVLLSCALVITTSVIFSFPVPAKGLILDPLGNNEEDRPSFFDLRDVNGSTYVTPVKNQRWGTCWTHGTLAAIESNLLMTGAWKTAGETGEPDLAEYHLDWWNGFNTYCNDDDPGGVGLSVHQGGNYLMAAAYLSRGEGSIRESDDPSQETPPERYEENYHLYYPQDIEWYTIGKNLTGINTIKDHLMTQGALGTCLCSNSQFIQDNIHYQPPSSTLDPNHAVAIIGWDDNKVTQAPQPGAWLCKNSWGDGWGLDGHFWISYYDKHCGHHPKMGAVSFQDATLLESAHIYYHDYHGWCGKLIGISEACNAFTATTSEVLQKVSFYTTKNDTGYIAKIYDSFQNNSLQHEKANAQGTLPYTGLHTVTLNMSVILTPGDDFYVYLYLSSNEHPIDITSEVTALLGSSSSHALVKSVSHIGESYYYDGVQWQDLYDWNNTANFCMKGLAFPPIIFSYPEGRPEIVEPGKEITLTVKLTEMGDTYTSGSGRVHYRYESGDYEILPLNDVADGMFTVTLPPVPSEGTVEYYFSLNGSLIDPIFDPPGAPAERYSIWVVQTPAVKGDGDGDGDIDIFDFDLFAQAWSSTSGDEMYQEIFDFDDDGDIGIFDFDCFAQIWGTKID